MLAAGATAAMARNAVVSADRVHLTGAMPTDRSGCISSLGMVRVSTSS